MPEVFLQLSCLNFIRQYSFRGAFDYSGFDGFRNASEEQLMHRVDACLERLALMVSCWADTAPIFRILRKDGSGSDYDMRSQHRCRNFERIKNWASENGVAGNLWTNPYTQLSD